MDVNAVVVDESNAAAMLHVAIVFIEKTMMVNVLSIKISEPTSKLFFFV